MFLLRLAHAARRAGWHYVADWLRDIERELAGLGGFRRLRDEQEERQSKPEESFFVQWGEG
jgi:hypothetical protein